MDWQDRISVDPKVLVGKPVIKGTRIAVEFVVDLLGRGWTMEQILREYDHLTAEDIQACLAYASEVPYYPGKEEDHLRARRASE